MSQQSIKDTPTHRYDLMSMRVDEIQGLITVLQHRRTLHIAKATAIKNNSLITGRAATDVNLKKTLDKLEKLIERMKRDDASTTALLNTARGLLLDASDGTLVLDKTEALQHGNN